MAEISAPEFAPGFAPSGFAPLGYEGTQDTPISGPHAPCTLEVIDNEAQLEAIAPALLSLNQHALEKNILFDPAVLLSSWRYLLGPKTQLKIITIWQRAPHAASNSERILIGFFPLMRSASRLKRIFEMITLRSIWRTSASDMSYCSMPLLHKDYSAEALAYFLKALERGVLAPSCIATPKNSAKSHILSALFPPVVNFRQIPWDSAFAQVIKTHQDKWQLTVSHLHQRAMLNAKQTVDAALSQGLSNKRRSKLARQKRKLEAQGALSFKLVSRSTPAQQGAEQTGDIEDALEAFLTLEAAGWKGRQGSAILHNAKALAYFKSFVPALAWRGQFSIAQFWLDDVLIAAGLIMIQGERAWFYKIAYDENFRAFSPGVLLTREVTQALLTDENITLGDSCAEADHPMINKIWAERAAIADLTLSPARNPIAQLTLLIESLRLSARSKVKWGYHGIKRAFIRRP